MIVIADSGSTKCDWIITNGQEEIRTKTQGFNPMFHSSELIEDKLRDNRDLSDFANRVEAVYYYGAGCQNGELNQTVYRALSSVFISASVHVDHDISAAVMATCKGAPGISCILGTGSNSAYFDGKDIHNRVSGLGYILGDEGSGSYFGKKLLSAFLYGQLPESINEELRAQGLSKETIINKVYMQPNANVYLASFMKFVSSHKDLAYFNRMIYKGLSDFIDLHIWNYPEHKNVPVHFVGSVAYYNRDILAQACENHRIQLGQIVQKPIDELTRIHLSQYQARA